MNARDIIGTAVQSTFRSKLRTTLTVIAIFIGAFTLTTTSAIGTGVSTYITAQVAAIGADDVLLVTKAAEGTPVDAGDGPQPYDPDAVAGGGGPSGPVALPGQGAPLTVADIDALRATDGVVAVTPLSSISPAWIEYGDNGRFEVSVNVAAGVSPADLAAGTALNNDTSDFEVLLPTSYLENLGFGSAESAIGETVVFGVDDYLGERSEVSATVVGIQNESLLGSGVSLNSALSNEMEEIGSTGKPSTIETTFAQATVQITEGMSSADIADLQDRLAEDGFAAQTLEDQLGTFQLVINGIVGVLNAFAVIALLAAGFGIVNTLLMSVQERTREIGLMKAMGMSGGRVFALFSLEAVFLGFLGSALGALASIAIGVPLSGVLSQTVLSGLPGLNVLQYAPGSVATVIFVVMGLAFVAGTLPARRAARQNPIEALRYE
ncbi:ABC transporter permease [Microbacterium lacus]|uniref:ABC transporter permease n=1 Tax=Microbacterium lacus TaxID=415217 RepID=UPI00384D8A1B